jgi:hypothetical protein
VTRLALGHVPAGLATTADLRSLLLMSVRR